MTSSRLPYFALPVLTLALSAVSASAQQQQQAWGPSQQSMYHNHPGGAPSYSGYGSPTGTAIVTSNGSRIRNGQGGTASGNAAQAKRVSAHTGPRTRAVKARRAE